MIFNMMTSFLLKNETGSIRHLGCANFESLKCIQFYLKPEKKRCILFTFYSFTFCFLAYELTHRRCSRIYQLGSKIKRAG